LPRALASIAIEGRPIAVFNESDPIVILSYARTPMGGMQGALADVAATDLGATVVKAAVERAGVSGDDIDRIYMGCVLPAGLGQAPARQAALKAGLPKSVEATTVNKVCGSGMQTVIMGAEALAAGSADWIVAGGMESMTNAPYLLKKHRSGARIGHDTAYDHMFLDGLEDAYEQGRAMGTFAQCTADEYQLTRAEMDEYSIESLARANRSPSRPARARSRSIRTSSRARATRRRSPSSRPLSRRKARSPPRPRAPSRMAPPRSC
jgi:acetyl-CoA C-acetyltransferase